jgi:hypothetical protein
MASDDSEESMRIAFNLFGNNELIAGRLKNKHKDLESCG